MGVERRPEGGDRIDSQQRHGRKSGRTEATPGSEAVGGDGDDLATDGAELAAHQVLDHRDRLRAGLEHAGVEQVAGEDALEAIGDLVLMDEDLLAPLAPRPQAD